MAAGATKAAAIASLSHIVRNEREEGLAEAERERGSDKTDEDRAEQAGAICPGPGGRACKSRQSEYGQGEREPA